MSYLICTSKRLYFEIIEMFFEKLFKIKRVTECVFNNFWSKNPKERPLTPSNVHAGAQLRSGWLLRNIHISNDNGLFTFYLDLSFLYHCQDLYRTWLYIWVTRRVYYKKQELLTLLEHLGSHPVFFFVLSYYVVFLVQFCSAYKRCSVRRYLQLGFVGGLMSYLRYLCLIAYNGVFFICLSSYWVLCTQCCQFLWIVQYFFGVF
jgi:hypothetical protein